MRDFHLDIECAVIVFLDRLDRAHKLRKHLEVRADLLRCAVIGHSGKLGVDRIIIAERFIKLEEFIESGCLIGSKPVI